MELRRRKLKGIWKASPAFLRSFYNGVKFRKSIPHAFTVFLSEEERGNTKVLRALKKDLISCQKKYRINADEYFLFGFRGQSDEYRSSFLTDEIKDSVLQRFVSIKEMDHQLKNKYNFYKLLGTYFKRNVMLVPSGGGDYQIFEEFAMKNRFLFMKRNNSSRGRGIRCCEVNTKDDAQSAWNSLVEDGDEWIIEEKIIQVPETAQWNPSSVNTVRLPAILNNGHFTVLGPFFRTGRAGAIADNAGAGGIFACIDPQSGVITSDGIDEGGIYYVEHPNSKKHFKGWQVPNWKDLLEFAEQIHKSIPHHKYVGWDFALSEKGWMLVEGNWGQFVSQYNDHIGLKKQFFELLGIEE